MRNIYLSGFMATGKSTVGKYLANRLQYHFTDLDQLIEAHYQLPIAKIFKKFGEAHFRQTESICLRQIAHRPKQVISLGGGAILALQNRQILQKGIWVNLNATPATIMKRLGSNTTRPLLTKKPKLADITQLLNQRRPYYSLAPYQINTNSLAPDAIASIVTKIVLQRP